MVFFWAFAQHSDAACRNGFLVNLGWLIGSVFKSRRSFSFFFNFTMATHTLFICTSCASVRSQDQPQPKSGGQELLEALTQLIDADPLCDRIAVEPVQCMFACEKSCTAAFTAAGKYTYLFAHLQPAAAPALWECARHYALDAEGLLPYSVRPEPLKTAVLARIPPQLLTLPPIAPAATNTQQLVVQEPSLPSSF